MQHGLSRGRLKFYNRSFLGLPQTWPMWYNVCMCMEGKVWTREVLGNVRRFGLLVRRYGQDMGEFVYWWRKYHGYGPLPWGRAFKNIGYRCNNSKDSRFHRYGGRGIRREITTDDLRKSFEQCRAWSMKKPSVDKIDNDKSYTPTNTRWLEFSDNVRRRWDGT